jgi:hypothetical protein
MCVSSAKSTRPLRFRSVVLDVRLCGFGGVVRRVLRVAVRDVGVVSGLLVVAVRVVHGSFLVMPGRVLVMFGSLVMVFSRVIAHGDLLRTKLSHAD